MSNNKYKPLTDKELKRMLELEELAVDHYLDKTDFDTADWLYDEEDTIEYKKLKNRDCGDEIYTLD